MAQKKHIKHHKIVKTVAERVRRARQRLGMSQQDLARKAQASLTYIGKLERGENSVGVDMLARLAEALGIHPAALLADDEPNQFNCEVVRSQFQKQAAKILARNDLTSLISFSSIMAHVDNSLSRRRS